ncbi:transposase [Rheinheimera sp. 1928-s]|uniref:transposase n=1 Tax=Rheinheimera sp. 1928-s TaxID=3033803 RepID=UPI00261F59A4|nr:transposase [Rheinheimera sp. 1928-s]MDF3125731.1 transposase [Rheinheimera sp. 1928-s]
MPRHQRYCPADVPQHVVQRGNNHQACFFDPQDFATYLNYLTEYKEQCQVDIHAWVLMSNHVHLLCTPKEEMATSVLMQSVGRKYVRYFNTRYQRCGTLWEGRFKSCLIAEEAYVLNVYRYIEMNPVRAAMVQRPEHYFWSSYSCNALGRSSALITPDPRYLALGENDAERQMNYRTLFSGVLAEEELCSIRSSLQQCSLLGSAVAQKGIAAKYGLSIPQQSVGRPRYNR